MNAVSNNFRRSRIKHFIGLIRVSTRKQADDNMSLNVQKERLQELAAEYPGAKLTLFEEIGSASKQQTKSSRPVLHAAIETAREDRATLVVVQIDRLARNLEVLPFLKGVKVLSLEQGYLDRKRLKRLLIDAANAAQAISEGSKTSAASRKARGEKLGNRVNLGVAQAKGCQNNRMRADNKVRALFALLRKEKELQFLTHQKLCETLNARGFLNQRSAREQVPWTKHTIRRPLEQARQMILAE